MDDFLRGKVVKRVVELVIGHVLRMKQIHLTLECDPVATVDVLEVGSRATLSDGGV